MTHILSFFHTKITDLLSKKSPTLWQPTLSRVTTQFYNFLYLPYFLKKILFRSIKDSVIHENPDIKNIIRPIFGRSNWSPSVKKTKINHLPWMKFLAFETRLDSIFKRFFFCIFASCPSCLAYIIFYFAKLHLVSTTDLNYFSNCKWKISHFKVKRVFKKPRFFTTDQYTYILLEWEAHFQWFSKKC
jgi:hypothetical protein